MVAFASGPLEITVLDSTEAVEGLEREWRFLWQADPTATPFQSPEWLIPWIRYLWGGGKLQVLVLRDASRLIAIAPLFLWGYGNTPEVIHLSFLGSGISDYLGMICAPEHAAEAGEAVLNWMLDSCAEWDICDLQELRPASSLLAAAGRHGLPVSECSVCPVLPLRDSLMEQLAAMRATLRRSLHTAEKRLRAAGELEFVRADERNRGELLDRLFDLHTARWQQQGEEGMVADGAVREFHREASRRLQESGMLRLYALRLNGRLIAVFYNLVAKGRAYAYLSGFDPEWAPLSPGSVLLARTIAEAISEGLRKFDFLRKTEEFKYAWGAGDTFTTRLLISRDR